jgi:hypothetical protein
MCAKRRPASALSEQGEDDGGPKNHPDRDKADNCYSLPPTGWFQGVASQCQGGFTPSARIPGVNKDSAHDCPPVSPTTNARGDALLSRAPVAESNVCLKDGTKWAGVALKRETPLWRSWRRHLAGFRGPFLLHGGWGGRGRESNAASAAGVPKAKRPPGSLAGWPLRRTAGSCSGSVHPLTHILSRPLRSAINKPIFRV